MSRWYQPQEQWPKHPKPWWRETLRHARLLGWSLRTIDGHSWGRIVCDPNLDEPCKYLVYSTGKAAESVAADAFRGIDRCPHLAMKVDDQVLTHAAALLDQAECLIGAADQCLQVADKATEVEELLESADSAAAEAEKLLEQAVQTEADAQGLLISVFAALPEGTQIGCPPSTTEVEGLVVEAEGRVDEAQELVGDLPVSQQVDSLRERIGQVRARMGGLSARLGDRKSVV